MEAKNILVIGSANMDLVMRTPRLPRAGESLIGTAFMTARGGKGANQAVAAARLGARVCFIGCVGADAFGALQREGFLEEGIDMSHLKVHPDLPTGTAMILLSEDGQNVIVVAASANYGLLPEDLDALRPRFLEAELVMNQLEIPLDTVERALGLANECGVFSVLDAGPARTVSSSLLALASLTSPNETEAEAMTGIVVDSIDAARAAAAQLRDMGAAHVVMKLGERGCLYMGDGEVHVPAFPVNVVDTTAAGDAFTAALSVAWGRLDLEDALLFANAAGALAASVEGAQPSMPNLEQVRSFLKERGRALAL